MSDERIAENEWTEKRIIETMQNEMEERRKRLEVMKWWERKEEIANMQYETKERRRLADTVAAWNKSTRRTEGFRKIDVLMKNPEIDITQYDMKQRLKLADIVAKDGHRTVADLGSMTGGMSYELLQQHMRVISTERYRRSPYLEYSPEENYFDSLKRVNENAVKCDSFQLPLRNLDAIVSYMFLGLFMKGRLVEKEDRTIADVFEELSKTADTIYSVERQIEYSEWFECSKFYGRKMLDPKGIEKKLKPCQTLR